MGGWCCGVGWLIEGVKVSSLFSPWLQGVHMVFAVSSCRNWQKPRLRLQHVLEEVGTDNFEYEGDIWYSILHQPNSPPKKYFLLYTISSKIRWIFVFLFFWGGRRSCFFLWRVSIRHNLQQTHCICGFVVHSTFFPIDNRNFRSQATQLVWYLPATWIINPGRKKRLKNLRFLPLEKEKTPSKAIIFRFYVNLGRCMYFHSPKKNQDTWNNWMAF